MPCPIKGDAGSVKIIDSSPPRATSGRGVRLASEGVVEFSHCGGGPLSDSTRFFFRFFSLRFAIRFASSRLITTRLTPGVSDRSSYCSLQGASPSGSWGTTSSCPRLVCIPRLMRAATWGVYIYPRAWRWCVCLLLPRRGDVRCSLDGGQFGPW